MRTSAGRAGCSAPATACRRDSASIALVDAPLGESAIIGSAVGLAVSGLVPVAEIQFLGFTHNAFNQIVEQLARLPLPLVGHARPAGDDSSPVRRRRPRARDAFGRLRGPLRARARAQDRRAVQSGRHARPAAVRDSRSRSGDGPRAAARLPPDTRRGAHGRRAPSPSASPTSSGQGPTARVIAWSAAVELRSRRPRTRRSTASRSK